MQIPQDKLIESPGIGERNFESIIQKIDDKKTYEKALRQANKKYDIKNFKVTNMTPVKARKIYPMLLQKYRQNLAQEQSWLQNQRRLFIWMVLCYVFVSQKSITELTVAQLQMFSSIFNNKKQDFLKFQIFALLKKDKKSSKWDWEEDQILVRVLESEGKDDAEQIEWNEVSKHFFQQSEHKFYRSSKQCRQRWMNHLDPNKVKGSWTVQQDLLLLKFAKQRGKKWSQMVRYLQGCKTQHMVKNRYNSLINKKGKQINSKNQEKILTKLIQQLQVTTMAQIKLEEEFKTSSKEAQSIKSNKSDMIKSEKNQDFPNIFENDNSANNFTGKKCKFFVQRAGSLSMSERGGLLPDLANPILQELDSEEERSRQKFLISTPLSERGGQMKSPFLNSPSMAGNNGNVTPSLFFLEENKNPNNFYASDFSMSFSSNFDKFVPQRQQN